MRPAPALPARHRRDRVDDVPRLHALLHQIVGDSHVHAGALAVLGWRVLGRVACRPDGGRELALELLAADAFTTYAFEAQAEVDATGLAALAERIAASEP